jgi:hypothetical protein
MDPSTKEMLLPALSPALILNFNNLEVECSATQVGEGDEEENLNLIEEHTKKWGLSKFSRDIDHYILMK